MVSIQTPWSLLSQISLPEMELKHEPPLPLWPWSA